MAVYEDTTTSHNIETDENFRTWVKAIIKAMESAGLVQTADTGQINTSTVKTPTTNSTFAGYTIWRFNDSEQAERPVYIKLEFGRGGAASRPALGWTVGRGSNGSGTLTNAIEGLITSEPSGETSATGYIHACFSEGSFHLFSCHSLSTTENGSILLVVERMRNPLGEIQDWLAVSEGTNFPKSGLATKSVGWWWTGSAWKGGWPLDPAASEAIGSFVRPLIIRPLRYPALPLIALMGFAVGQVSSGDTGTVRIDGRDLTYKAPPVSQQIIGHLWIGGLNEQSHTPILLHQ